MGHGGVDALKYIGNVFVALVGVQHLAFMALETFLWRGKVRLPSSPRITTSLPHLCMAQARAVFRHSKADADRTAVLAANQGFYNGLLAAGCFWGLAEDSVEIQTYFLTAVVVCRFTLSVCHSCS